MTFFAEAVISGLLTGVMYSLVALGFVLIYKASGVFNFAQGVMALFAALTLTGLMDEYKLPVWAAIPLTILVMIALAFLVERFILRYLVNQEPIVLFMATLGLAYGLEGLGDMIWGPDVKVLPRRRSSSRCSRSSSSARAWGAPFERWPTIIKPLCQSVFRSRRSG
jgi:branched-chain amino acid transport system permease protein